MRTVRAARFRRLLTSVAVIGTSIAPSADVSAITHRCATTIRHNEDGTPLRILRHAPGTNPNPPSPSIPR